MILSIVPIVNSLSIIVFNSARAVVRNRLLILTVLLCVLSTGRVHADATLTGLGVFGANSSAARDVSGDGSVVVGTVRGFFNEVTGIFRWTATGSMTRSGSASEDIAVSDDGSVVVGGFPINGARQAFRWTTDGTFEALGDLPGGIFSSGAFDISANGRVVVGFGSAAIDDEAFRWTPETGMVGIGDLPGGQTRSIAFGVSADGAVVVGEGHGEGPVTTQAFRWTAESGMIGLGVLPGATDVTAHQASADGSVVVGTYGLPRLGHLQPQRGAFRWTVREGMISLGDLPGGLNFSQAYDVSADGSVIVGASQTLGQGGMSVPAPFYWTAATGMLNLEDVLRAGGANLAGWTLIEARGVSADGLTVVGFGSHNGIAQAWIATIPEPPTGALAVVAVAGIVAFCFRRRKNRLTYKTLTYGIASDSSRRWFLRKSLVSTVAVALARFSPRESAHAAQAPPSPRGLPDLSRKTMDRADVRDFGAKGDGITDDGPAFRPP